MTISVVVGVNVGEMLSPAILHTVLLVRHGQTTWNRERRRQGREDTPLDEVGAQQAVALGEELADTHIDLAFSSPLSRARCTAAAVLVGRPIELRIDERLLEFDYGSMSGTVRGEVPLSLKHDHMDIPVPGGESLRQAWGRAERFAAHLSVVSTPGATILVVGHGRQHHLLAGVLRGWDLPTTAKSKDTRLAPATCVEIVVARD